MARYFFDHRDGETLIVDHEGLDFDGIESVRTQVTAALADAARDALAESTQGRIAIEVRDEASRPVLKGSLSFDVQLLE